MDDGIEEDELIQKDERQNIAKQALEKSLGAAPGQFAYDQFKNYNNDQNASPDYIGNNSLNYQ